MTYPEKTGHTAGSQTSQAAAEAMDEGRREKEIEILERALKACGSHGMIAEEAKQVLIASGAERTERGQASARLSDMCSKRFNMAVGTSRSRKSEFSNRHQMVVVHISHATDEEKAAAREHKETKREFYLDELGQIKGFIDALVKTNAISLPTFARNAPLVSDRLENLIKDFR